MPLGGASNYSGYANKRAEMWGSRKDWISNRAIKISIHINGKVSNFFKDF